MSRSRKAYHPSMPQGFVKIWSRRCIQTSCCGGAFHVRVQWLWGLCATTVACGKRKPGLHLSKWLERLAVLILFFLSFQLDIYFKATAVAIGSSNSSSKETSSKSSPQTPIAHETPEFPLSSTEGKAVPGLTGLGYWLMLKISTFAVWKTLNWLQLWGPRTRIFYSIMEHVWLWKLCLGYFLPMFSSIACSLGWGISLSGLVNLWHCCGYGCRQEIPVLGTLAFKGLNWNTQSTEYVLLKRCLTPGQRRKVNSTLKYGMKGARACCPDAKEVWDVQ